MRSEKQGRWRGEEQGARKKGVKETDDMPRRRGRGYGERTVNEVERRMNIEVVEVMAAFIFNPFIYPGHAFMKNFLQRADNTDVS